MGSSDNTSKRGTRGGGTPKRNNSYNSSNSSNYASPASVPRGGPSNNGGSSGAYNGRSPVNPYHRNHRGGHGMNVASLMAKYPIQTCIVLGLVVIICSTVNMARLSGNIMIAVNTEVKDPSNGLVSVAKTVKKLGKAALQDDDKYVKIPKQVFDQHFIQKEDGTPLLRGLDANKQQPQATVPPVNKFFTDEEEHVFHMEQKLLQKDGYDYHKAHHDLYYQPQREAPQELYEDKENAQWVEPIRKYHQVSTTKHMMADGHINLEVDYQDLDVDHDPYVIPSRAKKTPWSNRWDGAGKLPIWAKVRYYYYCLV